MAQQGERAYSQSVYLAVTDDANRWREGPPKPQQIRNQSKVGALNLVDRRNWYRSPRVK